jgi:beta-hydroxyacyl-[acyl carrier protein] dehydratase FabZ
MLNVDEIQKIIPHRPPFLLVDRIDEMEAGVNAIGRKCVTMNEPFFQGHFPGKAVMPGVLIIEALAQVGAICMLSVPGNEGKIAFFGAIDNVKFKRQVYPGDVLTLEVQITKNKGSFGVGTAKASVDGKVAVQAVLTFAIGE